MRKTLSRRTILKGTAALGVTAFAASVKAASPEPVSITPELVDAAKKEGKVILYSSMDLPVGEKLGKAFEAKYPGMEAQIERSGAERLFQRVAQEYSSNIHAADIINTTDASHIITWKRNGWLAPFVSEDMAQHFLPAYRDPDGMSATSRIYLSSIAYNTNLVRPEDAPKSFADLLAPKWAGTLVKRPTEKMVARRGRREGRRQRIWRGAAEGGRPAGRAGVSDRRTADDLGADRDLRRCAASQCRAAVSGMAAHARDAAVLYRLHGAILGACGGHPEARTAQ